MSRQRFIIVCLLLLGIVGLLAAAIFLPVRPLQIELLDFALGAITGALATAVGWYFKS